MTEKNTPKIFDAETAERDWGGPGREIEKHPRHPYGIRIRLSSGWEFSAIWGSMSYTNNARGSEAGFLGTFRDPAEINRRSFDAEVMPLNPDGNWVDFGGDINVASFVTPTMFAQCLEAAARDDDDGVIRALTHRHSEIY